MTLNWTNIGRELRESAMDAHDGELPGIGIAYSFLTDNPECFLPEGEEWPADLPSEPDIELLAAYYGICCDHCGLSKEGVRIMARFNEYDGPDPICCEVADCDVA